MGSGFDNFDGLKKACSINSTKEILNCVDVVLLNINYYHL